MSEEKRESARLAVGNEIEQVGNAMDEAERFIGGLGLDNKTTMRVRLLAEEILEMVRSMVGEFDGKFWVEATDAECRIHLEGKADINIERENDLMSVSKDGTNVSVKGFSAKLSQLIRHSKEYVADFLAPGDGVMPISGDYLYIGEMGGIYNASNYLWSMCDYREYLYDDTNLNEKVEEERDELEKSIVANLADDVQVGVIGDNISLTVIKKIA